MSSNVKVEEFWRVMVFAGAGELLGIVAKGTKREQTRKE
jgi:hypothetical protein